MSENASLKNGSEKKNGPKIAVVIGSGGIKPMAAIPLFEFLDEAGIDIDLIVGCSGGAIVAGMRGIGYSSAEMKDLISQHLNKNLFSNVDYRTLLGIAKLPFGKFNKTSGILKPEKLKKVLHTIYKDKNIEDMKIKTLIQVTDVDTGEGVVLEKGNIADAVYGSAAQFPFFPPINVGNKWFVDGVYSAPLPVLEAIKRDMDVIIAVAIEQQVKLKSTSFIEYFHHFISRSYTSTQKKQMALAIDLHHHEIVILNVHFDEVINMWEIDKLPLIMETGRKVIDSRKEDILSAINEYKNKKQKD